MQVLHRGYPEEAPSPKLHMCITYMMEVERRASEGAYSIGGKRDMNFQARLFPDEILVMAQRLEPILLARLIKSLFMAHIRL